MKTQGSKPTFQLLLIRKFAYTGNVVAEHYDFNTL